MVNTDTGKLDNEKTVVYTDTQGRANNLDKLARGRGYTEVLDPRKKEVRERLDRSSILNEKLLEDPLLTINLPLLRSLQEENPSLMLKRPELEVYLQERQQFMQRDPNKTH